MSDETKPLATLVLDSTGGKRHPCLVVARHETADGKVLLELRLVDNPSFTNWRGESFDFSTMYVQAMYPERDGNIGIAYEVLSSKSPQALESAQRSVLVQAFIARKGVTMSHNVDFELLEYVCRADLSPPGFDEMSWSKEGSSELTVDSLLPTDASTGGDGKLG